MTLTDIHTVVVPGIRIGPLQFMLAISVASVVTRQGDAYLLEKLTKREQFTSMPACDSYDSCSSSDLNF